MPQPAGPALDGNWFEDFFVGQRFRHATPRTITAGDASLHIALTGARQPLFCAAPLAARLGHPAPPIDDMLVFNMAFGKTVADISGNAVANLGYADLRFCRPVYAGDTIRAESEVIGLRPTSSGDAGVVYVRSTAHNQHGLSVMSWIRWVLVHKRDLAAPDRAICIPTLPDRVATADFSLPLAPIEGHAMVEATGSVALWEDYRVGLRIDHPAGMTLDESDHVFATRLYQNTARVHFDALMMCGTPKGRRLVYGGQVIAVCRALAYDGLENVVEMLAINGGMHCAPTFAGDTLYCYSEVLERIELPGRRDCGALRLRLTGIRNAPAAGFVAMVGQDGALRRHPDVVLDLDYTVLMPRKETPCP
jgi:2-methylfumaryl-CoA hydratase